MKKIDEYLKKLINEKKPQPVAITGLILIVIATLLKSGLVTVIIALLQLIFMLGGLALLAYAVYLAYPLLVKKYKN